MVLEFDHVRGNKRSTVMTLVKNGYSLDVIQAEVAKCVVRCANCHKRKTYRGSWRG
jgi:prophage maintenance system killer protein